MARSARSKPKAIDARDADLAGSRFENVDLTRAQMLDCDLAGVVISGCRTDDMTIDGVRVSDLFEAYAQWSEG